MAQKTLEERILYSISRNPGATPGVIAKNVSCPVATVREVMSRASIAETKPAAPAPQFALGVSLANLKVLPRRPAESAAQYIKQLENGRGFVPADLAKAWGMSEETIKRHARDLGCLKYVEVREDEWVPMILSPETATKYR